MNDPTLQDGSRPTPADQTTAIPLRAPPGKSEGLALSGFTEFEPIVPGLCWATSPQGEPAMIQVEGFPNVEYRDFMRRQRMLPTLFEVSAEAWRKKAASLRRAAQRRRQKARDRHDDDLLSVTAAAMRLRGNRSEVARRIRETIPLRPSPSGTSTPVVRWGDVRDAFIGRVIREED